MKRTREAAFATDATDADADSRAKKTRASSASVVTPQTSNDAEETTSSSSSSSDDKSSLVKSRFHARFQKQVDDTKKPRTVTPGTEDFSEQELSAEDLSDLSDLSAEESEEDEYERKEREEAARQDSLDKLSILEEFKKNYDTGAYAGLRIVVQLRREEEELLYGYQYHGCPHEFGYFPDEDKKALSAIDKHRTRTMFVVKAEVFDSKGHEVGYLGGYLFNRPTFKFSSNANDGEIMGTLKLVNLFCDNFGTLRPPITAWSTNERFVHPMLCESASEGGLLVIQKVEVKHRGKALGSQLLEEVLVALKDKWSLSVLDAQPLNYTKWTSRPEETYNKDLDEYDEGKLINYLRIQKQIRSAYARVGFIQLGHMSSGSMFLTAERFFQPVSSASTCSSGQCYRTRLTRQEVANLGLYVQLTSECIFKGVNKQLRDLVGNFCKVFFKKKSKACAKQFCRGSCFKTLLFTQTRGLEVPYDAFQVCPWCLSTTFNDVARPDVNLQQFIQDVQKLQQAGATLHASRALFLCVDLVKKIGTTLFDVEGFESTISALLNISTNTNEINQVRGGDELESVLHFAASSACKGTEEGEDTNLDLLSVLVKLGADVTMKNSQGYQPIDICNEVGRGDVEAMLAVATLDMRSILLDGWMSPVASAVLCISLCDISTITDIFEFEKESVLGKVFPGRSYWNWPQLEFIPSETLKQNSNGLCADFILGYAYVCGTIREVMEIHKQTPTLANVQAYINGQDHAKNFSAQENAPVTRKEAEFFFNNGGKIQYVLDGLFHAAQNQYVEKGCSDIFYLLCYKNQLKHLPKTPFDELVLKRYGYFKCSGGGENIHLRGPHCRYM